LARLELKIMIEETLQRYPAISLASRPVAAEALFLNQLKTLPVRLVAQQPTTASVLTDVRVAPGPDDVQG
jgi:hypothetical protein